MIIIIPRLKQFQSGGAVKRIIEEYKAKGFRLTPQRIAVLEYLEGNTTHPTAEDIFIAIKKKHPTVSFATVYNTIQALKDVSGVTEVTIDPARKRYDPNTKVHHHIVCVKCGRIGDVMAEYANELALPKNVLKEFTVIGSHVDFYGVCRGCEN